MFSIRDCLQRRSAYEKRSVDGACQEEVGVAELARRWRRRGILQTIATNGGSRVAAVLWQEGRRRRRASRASSSFLTTSEACGGEKENVVVYQLTCLDESIFGGRAIVGWS